MQERPYIDITLGGPYSLYDRQCLCLKWGTLEQNLGSQVVSWVITPPSPPEQFPCGIKKLKHVENIFK